jgi:ABC-type amino acid transport substrate-binding protein
LALLAVVLGTGAVLLMPRPESDPPAEPAGADVPTLDDGTLTVWARPTHPYSLAAVQGPVGFEIDIVTEVARRLGLQARVVAAEGDPFAALVEGRADAVVAAALATADLEARVNLSQPYLRVVQALVVNADVRPDLRSRDDLVEGDDVAVVEGDTGHTWAVATLEPEALEIHVYPDAESAAVALTAGDVDAVLVDEADAVAAVGVRPVLRIIETVPTGAGLAIAVDPRNGSLLRAINESLVAMAADGAYDRIYERYGSSLPPGGRITAA